VSTTTRAASSAPSAASRRAVAARSQRPAERGPRATIPACSAVAARAFGVPVNYTSLFALSAVILALDALSVVPVAHLRWKR
jgi:hypothetical protein